MPTNKKYSKYNKDCSDEYEAIFSEFKKCFKLSPKSIDHLIHMGYTNVSDFVAKGKTPKGLSQEINQYLTKHHQQISGKPFDYQVVFRRIQWFANASEAERESATKEHECSYWRAKALNARGLDIGENGEVVPLSSAKLKDEIKADDEACPQGKRKTSGNNRKVTKKAKIEKDREM